MKLKNPIGLVWSFLKKKKIEEALLNSKNQIKTRKSVFYVFGRFFDYFFFDRPKFQKWNLIKNPWYTKILHCTTLIFIKKLEFCDFF